MKNEKAAIIIVNWNGRKLLKDCFNAILKQTYKNYNIYFVDNGSVDGSSKYVSNFFSNVKMIQLDKNYGFAKGNNEGIKEALKDKNIQYIICLNNDTIVDKNWLGELIKTANSKPKIGAVSSKAYFIGKKVIQNAGLKYENTIQSNQMGGISIGFGLTDKQAPQLSKNIEIFAAGGVAPLFKREVVEILLKRDGEFFDENFFAYVEDLDLGFRIRAIGYIAFLAPNAKLIHLHSQTGGVASPFKAYYCERNSILTAVKNFSLINLILFPFRNIWLKISYFFKKHESTEKLKGNIGYLRIVWILIKAHFSAFLLIPKFIIKRLRIKK